MSQQTNDELVKATVRGLAISMVIAVAVYLVTDQVFLGLLVIGVASAVAAASIWGRRGERTPRAVGETVPSPFKQALLNERLVVRFAALFGAAALLFVLAWLVGYYLLTEGAVAGTRTESNTVATESTLVWELLRILTWNLTLPLIAIVGANLLLRINGYPLGYLMPLLWSLWYGLIIGSNSFAIPMVERMAPSLAVLQRAGPYEFAGYCLIAVATYGLPRFEMKHFLEGKIERVLPTPLLLTFQQWFGLGLGLLVVVLAGRREAMMIVALLSVVTPLQKPKK